MSEKPPLPTPLTGEDSQPVSSPVRPERWAILALLLLFLSSVPALFSIPAEPILFNPQVYQQELDQLGFYEQYPAILGESFAGGGDLMLPGAGQTLLRLLDRGNYQQLIRQLFPESWVRAQAESLIDQFWAYYNFETPELHLIVDFGPVKERLQGAEELPMVQTIVEGLPVCTQEDLFQIGLLALQGKLDEAPLCRPPDQLIGVANALVREALRGAGSLAPGRVDLVDTMSLPAFLLRQNVSALPLSFRAYRLFRTLGPWLPGLALVLLAVLAWVSRRTARGAVFWSGAGMLLPGFVALLITLFLGLGSNQIVPALVGRLFFAELAVFEWIVRLVTVVSNRYLMAVGGASLACTLLGIGLMGLGYYLGQRAATVALPEE